MGTRLLTAGIGIAVALIVLLLHNTFVLPLAAGIIAVCMLLELLHVNNLLRYHLSAVCALGYALILPMLQTGIEARYRLMLTVIAVTGVMYDYVRHKKRMEAKSFFIYIGGMLLIPPAMALTVTLNNTHEQHGLAYLVLALCGAWIADSGAYFIGTLFGRAKLCPEISPKKTVAGFIGALIANVLFYVIFCGIYLSVMTKKGVAMHVNWFAAILIAMVCAVLGTLGDLTASTLKRQLGIKDYGKIMPGHGGILDRFDSVLIVLPFFTAFVQATSFFEL
ncbi:MAG: phosphatidate cytidylyltransferase [Oscillospiraceae bacterium]|nr:phosphatidate cytidylyltransferase [Oscillospiraceae bacterium]